METAISAGIMVETAELPSESLARIVTVNFYLPATGMHHKDLSLLLVNDGQDLEAMGFDKITGYLHQTETISPLLVVGIHSGDDRINEYGMLSSPDYKGRGARAGLYRKFIFEELLPYIYSRYSISGFKERAFAGFSLGGLSALDLVWNHPDVFSKVGVFSGSLWWRIKNKSEKDYKESRDRIMHRQVREGQYHPGLKFFFQCGEQDETEDRNNNGIIDSIDDTLDLMRELLQKGCLEGKDMTYLQLPDGRHDVVTWSKALPEFLKWGWGRRSR